MRSRALVKLLTLAALVAGAIMLALPAAASADALVQTQVSCVAFANGGANKYEGFGTNVITATGAVVLTCHLTLVSGAPVEQPTWTTQTGGNCELLQLPDGRAQLNCHYAL